MLTSHARNNLLASHLPAPSSERRGEEISLLLLRFRLSNLSLTSPSLCLLSFVVPPLLGTNQIFYGRCMHPDLSRLASPRLVGAGVGVPPPLPPLCAPGTISRLSLALAWVLTWTPAAVNTSATDGHGYRCVRFLAAALCKLYCAGSAVQGLAFSCHY